MGKTVFDRAGCRHQGLAHHLSTENPLPAVFGAAPAKKVFFQGFNIKNVEKSRYSIGHETGTCNEKLALFYVNMTGCESPPE